MSRELCFKQEDNNVAVLFWLTTEIFVLKLTSILFSLDFCCSW